MSVDYTRKVICPFCGNNEHKKIREFDDKSKPLYHFSYGIKPMFAKKYVCTDCKHEWGK